ncbi:MAG: DUF87 domain-containing protein [Anaerolineae bacterium]|nr:DUF87 domain-containing protein [Anaerolineae bacterium]
MNLKRRARTLSTIVLMLLAKENLTGATVTQAHRGARHLSLGLKLADPTELDKALKLAEAIALSSNSENVLAQRQAGLILYQFQLVQGFWESYTRADLPTPAAVGLAEQRRPVSFELDPPHALIAGTTGSGKSETVKSVLLSLMGSYSPAELSLILVDPNHDYSDFDNAAYLAQPIAHDADSIRQALTFANRELVNRLESNNRAGKLLVVAIDEAESDPALGDTVNLEFARNIAKQGRKYRVHLLIASQKPTQKTLAGLVDQTLNRFVGLVADAHESARLTGHSGLDAHKLTGKGDFIHIAGPSIARFQVALATRQDFDQLERAEVRPVEVVSPDVIILPDDLAFPDNTGGRPPLEVDPVQAARYLWHNPNTISIARGQEEFGLSRRAHNLHKEFTIQFANELKRLRKAMRV